MPWWTRLLLPAALSTGLGLLYLCYTRPFLLLRPQLTLRRTFQSRLETFR